MAFYGTTQVEALQGPLPIERLPVAASQTLKVGNLVYLVSGQVTVVPATDPLNTSTWTAGLLGVMAEDSLSQPANTLVSVIPFNDNVVVTSRAVGTPTVAQIGTTVSVKVVASTLEIQLNSGDTSNGLARLVGLEYTDSRSAPGTKDKIGTIPANARIRWKLIPASRQGG